MEGSEEDKGERLILEREDRTILEVHLRTKMEVLGEVGGVMSDEDNIEETWVLGTCTPGDCRACFWDQLANSFHKEDPWDDL